MLYRYGDNIRLADGVSARHVRGDSASAVSPSMQINIASSVERILGTRSKEKCELYRANASISFTANIILM
jgi:hypothetical protein